MMNKWSKLAWIALASLVVAGCSAQGKAETQETIVINEDVQLESSLADSSLEVSRQEDIEVGREISYTGILGKFDGQHIYFNENSNFYAFDPKTGKEQGLLDSKVIEISDTWQSMMSYEDGELNVYNLQSGEKYFVVGGSPESVAFLGDEVVQFDYTTNVLSLINIEEKEIQTMDLHNYPDATISSIKKSGAEVYLAARSGEEGFGVYRMSISQGETTPVVEFEGKGTSFSEFDILQNGSIIFNGDYNGKTGVFYWNQETNDVQLLVSGGKSKEGIWTPFYNLSPDESKILFDTPVQIEDDFKTNVYMAELVDGQLANSVRIMENADLYSVITYSGHWSEDSKTAYITTVRDTEYIGNIAVFNVND